MKPVVLHASDVRDLEEQLSRSTGNGYQPSLAVVFAGDSPSDDSVLKPFRDRSIAVFGGTSSEEIADGRLTRGTIVCMLFDLDRAHYRQRFFEPGDGRAMGRSIAQWSLENFSNPILLLMVGGAGLTVDIESLLSAIFENSPGLPVFGGLTSSASDTQTNPPLFDSDGLRNDGVQALIFDNDIVDMRGVAISGWMEVGTPKRITRSSGNIVYEIEGMPANRFYERYFKIAADAANRILTVSEYPIRILREDGTRIMRTAIQMMPETGAVLFGGAVPEGALVRFCSPNIVETIKHTIDQLQAFKGDERESGADAVLLFDCAIRSRSFGRYMEKEIQVIRELWNAPMVGFCSWGEIGNGPGEACGFHNTVISTVIVRGRDSAGSTGARNYSVDQVQSFVEGVDPAADLTALRAELSELRKQKHMLSNFLHMTSEDLEAEQRKSEELLLNILPGPIAERLKAGAHSIADGVDSATILFADLVGFTKMSSGMAAGRLVRLLNVLFSSFDELARKYGVEKIKTIGDAYMAVAGLPEARADHAQRALRLANGLLKVVEKFNQRFDTNLEIRIGLNSGPVVAGVIGKHKFSYDLWGDAVNVASRMESSGVPGRIQVSESTHKLLKDSAHFEERGPVEIKGKGTMRTFLFVPDPPEK